jgi:hypothetical protein
MAEKEERILIDVINPGINCVYRLDNDPKGQSLCKHNGNMEPVTAKECRHCDEGMTRQEAIEKMAKALYLFNRDDEWYKEHADIYSKYMNKFAEAALNALLEVK